MKLNFNMPVRALFEENCVMKHSEIFAQCGASAMIVAGHSSAERCGALSDVETVLTQAGIKYIYFNKVENNPSMETVAEAAKLAKENQVDFIIGIGGGSPIDAAKAIAVLGANDMEVDELFKNQFTKALPIIAIPTTSGTGSEVTPYSVLLSKAKQTKLSFGNQYTFPAFALLDAKYTYSLGREATINTAVDAFTHCFEGYLAKRSTELSNALAIDGIRSFGECIPALLSGEFTEEIRSKLMYVSMLGGMVISHTGVTIAHGMGYCYTFFHDIPHGRANGLLMKEYVNYNYPVVKDKIDYCMETMGLSDISAFGEIMEQLVGKAPSLTDADIDKYTELTLLQKGSISNTAKDLNEERIHKLWEAVRN